MSTIRRWAAIGLCLWPVSSVLAATPASQSQLPALVQAIKNENTRLQADREHLQQIQKNYLEKDDLSEDDFNWLKKIAEHYNLEPKQRQDQRFFDDLLTRLDNVPASLLITQSWLESGWQPNSKIGWGLQCPPASKNCRAAPIPHQTQESVAYYIHELNTQPQYNTFRQQRLNLRTTNQALTGDKLVDSLPRSSNYNQRLPQILKKNRFTRWD